MTYGLTATGFNRKPLSTIVDELEAGEKALISTTLNTQPTEPFGLLNGIFASKLSELWELAEAINAGRFPLSSEGFQLDGVTSITGTRRADATKGRVTLTLTATSACVVPKNSIVQVVGDASNRWKTLADVTFVGAGSQDVLADAEIAGVYVANTGTITVIVTAVAGWSAVTNAAPAVPGTEIDTDPQLRIRREQELAIAGSGTVNAIRADLLQVAGVTGATVFDNPTNAVDEDGLPPHSVEALVLGGTDADVAAALFETLGAGKGTVGGVTEIVTDSQGMAHYISFSRPTSIDMLVEIDLIVDSQTYPANGDDLVADAVAAFILALPVGNDVFLAKLHKPVDTVAGIINISNIRIGSVAPAVAPVAIDYLITARQLATMTASTNVSVVSTPGSA